jgi:hypothetical protein
MSDPTQFGRLDSPSGKPSAGRLFHLLTVLTGMVAIVGGLVLAYVEVTGKTGTNQGSTIVLAGLGALFTGGAAHTGQAWAESKMYAPTQTAGKPPAVDPVGR